MNKIRNHVTFLFVAISTFLNAQITISNPDFIPIGRTFIMAFDTISHQPGNAGANQIWNFSSLKSNFLDSIQVDHPNSTPYANYFPSANASLSSPTTAYYQYFSNISTGFYMLGAVVVTSPNPPSVSAFYPQSKYFQWPMNYLDSFTDSCINISIYVSQVPSGTDTAKYITHYYEHTLVDSWGKITTPMGTYDCLRQRKLQTRIDSSWYFSSQAGTWSFTNTYTDTSIIYDWMSNDPGTGFILTEITYIQVSGMYSGVYWMKDAISGINNYEHSYIISVYPNPNFGEITVSTGNIIADEIYVSDALEKSTFTFKPSGLKNKINLNKSESGFYLVCVRFGDSMSYKKIIKK